jgi:predicted metal-dependent enzyme (double-stranded beta helix superfamily)
MTIKKLINEIQNQLLSNPNFKDENIKKIIENYDNIDWKEYVKIDKNTHYKNQLFKNEFFEIFVITWNIDQKVNIHNHSKNGCWLKLLQGILQENIYNHNDLSLINNKILIKDNISFIDDKIGFHSIKNIGNEIATSLHIYSPPSHITKFF